MRKLPFFAAALLLTAQPALADEVTFTTALAPGQMLNVAINGDAQATLTWEGGSTVQLSSGSLQQIAVEAANATISATGSITRLYLSDDALTALSVTNAPALQRLICSDNQLATLSLTNNTLLEELDVQNNQLKTLALTKHRALETVNVANNELTTLSTVVTTTLKTLIVTGNKFTDVSRLSSFSKLEQLWAANNQLTKVTVTNAANLKQLWAADNQIATLSMAASCPMLTDVLLETNLLGTLDLTNAPKLQYLSADNNQLSTITWNSDTKKTCKYAYLHGNRLFFNSLPMLEYTGKKLNVTIDNQLPYPLLADNPDVGGTVDFTDALYRTGWGQLANATVTFTNGAGTPLVEGTDYTKSAQKYTFLTYQENVVLTATTTRYPDVVFTTAPFGVGNSTGIANVGAATGAEEIYSLQGVKMNAKENLPAGVYIVNGKKVVIK